MSILRSLKYTLHQLRHTDARSLARAIKYRVWPARSKHTSFILDVIRDQVGLEVGGPSNVFRAKQLLPIYPLVKRIDNVNFASTTAWESDLHNEGAFSFHPTKSPGRQFLREATHLQGFAAESYDFLLSSHCLEHLANPLAALREWNRVIRPGGHLVLIVPNREYTFDHRRPVTLFAHLQSDFEANMREDDLTHLKEILEFHNLRRDPGAGTPEEFHARSLQNRENRCLHHHVFDLDLLDAALKDTGWRTLYLEKVPPLHLLAFGVRDH
ncbi:MAG: class I SAM-dependent methyltransferase [Opitutaceae bacterium]|nr:class I SAM-dependent methyltransferase [Opitutaceae bacterium]